MRASRETELAKDYPIHVVTAWLGNTPRIAMKHYLQVTDDDFERAAQGGAECGAHSALIDADLETIIDGWFDLPAAVRVGILAMVRAARG
jgi:hypothetical protein